MMNMVMFIMTGDVPSLIAGMACLAIGLICAAADA